MCEMLLLLRILKLLFYSTVFFNYERNTIYKTDMENIFYSIR